MKIRFSGQAAAVTNAYRPDPDDMAAEQTYFDELLQAIRDSEEQSAARRFWLNEWIQE